VALTAKSNVTDLADQARRTHAKFVAIADETCLADLKSALADTNIACGGGARAVLDAAAMDSDWTMAAIVGAAGLAPTLQAVKQGHCVAFANKEALVCAGQLFMDEARRAGTRLLPVDSEHNAIYQVFNESQREGIRRIILTATGGPFLSSSLEDMAQAGPEQAVAHPTWSMGSKISIDSATMMNKGLEIIEACHLFNMHERDVDVLVHPDAIVHGLVEYIDGGVLAQMGSPDMRTPIGHALGWPTRIETPVKRLDLVSIGQLNFFAHDPVRFPAINLAREAIRIGGLIPAILNAANEVAVEAFLNNHIGFLDIVRVVNEAVEEGNRLELKGNGARDFEAVFEADAVGRRLANTALKMRA
jgi:1-deoxy-D-xylulose-5-phosphate reductoisomerase